MAARAVAYETSPPGTDPGPEPPKPEEPTIRPWLGEPVWCGRCTSMVHQELAELDDLAAMLLAIPDLRGGADQAGKVSGTRGQRSPSPFADDVDELAAWLRSWESLARGTDPAPRRGYLATEITATAAWLVTHFEQLITNPDIAADYGSEIRGWHRTLKARAHAGSATKHMPRPCPRCRMYTLWATDGEDYVVCKNEDCRRLMSREEYRDLTEDRVLRSTPKRTLNTQRRGVRRRPWPGCSITATGTILSVSWPACALTGQSLKFTRSTYPDYPGMQGAPCWRISGSRCWLDADWNTRFPFGVSIGLTLGRREDIAHEMECANDDYGCRLWRFCLDLNPPLGEPNRLYVHGRRRRVTLGLLSLRGLRDTGEVRDGRPVLRECLTWPHLDGISRYRYHLDESGEWARDDKPAPGHWGWLTIERI